METIISYLEQIVQICENSGLTNDSTKEYIALTGSASVVLQYYAHFKKLPQDLPGDFDFVSNAKSNKNNLSIIGDYRRQHAYQIASCTYLNEETGQSFDLDLDTRVAVRNLTLFGYTICVQQCASLLRKYKEHTDVESNEPKQCINRRRIELLEAILKHGEIPEITDVVYKSDITKLEFTKATLSSVVRSNLFDDNYGDDCDD